MPARRVHEADLEGAPPLRSTGLRTSGAAGAHALGVLSNGGLADWVGMGEGADQVARPELRAELLRRLERDQAARWAATRRGEGALDRLVRVDRENSGWLARVLEERRLSAGLPPLADQDRAMRETYGLPKLHSSQRPVLVRGHNCGSPMPGGLPEGEGAGRGTAGRRAADQHDLVAFPVVAQGRQG